MAFIGQRERAVTKGLTRGIDPYRRFRRASREYLGGYFMILEF